MRILVLILLWLGIAGFGLMTACSGVFVFQIWQIALPVGLVSGALTWGCVRAVMNVMRGDEQPPRATATPATPAPQAPPAPPAPPEA